MTTAAEYDTKPGSVPGCPGTMVLTMRAVSVGGTNPRWPGWVCEKNPDHIEWVFGLDVK